MGDLEGKVALVTGGSRGMGAAIAKRLAHDGADVALTYLNEGDKAHGVVADIEATGHRGVAIAADSADPDALVAAIDRAASELGGLDVLVNNAGIYAYGPPEAVTLDEVDRIMAIHVRAPFVAAQAAVRHMSGGGRIINIGSSLATRVPYPGVSLYAMSKSALIGMTKGLARDLGERGITVNTVDPGSTDTDMNPANSPEADDERSLTALGTYGSVDDVAATVAHLAGPGGRNITGTAIAVDGGIST